MPNAVVIPKSWSCVSGETILVKNPTIVPKVASVKAIPTELNVLEADVFTEFFKPNSSLYLPVKWIA